jgi:hypothetical protein
MIDAVWLHVLQQIPPDYRDAISIVTVTGAELVVQQIFKLERDFMVLRARTAGTMDTGRTIICAYAQIDFVGFNKKMSEEEVMTIFKEPVPEFAAPAMQYQAIPLGAPGIPAPLVKPIKPLAETPEPATGSIPATEPAAENPSSAKPGQISKTILLARLRERLAEKSR